MRGKCEKNTRMKVTTKISKLLEGVIDINHRHMGSK
jgi:hypothetical protein